MQAFGRCGRAGLAGAPGRPKLALACRRGRGRAQPAQELSSTAPACAPWRFAHGPHAASSARSYSKLSSSCAPHRKEPRDPEHDNIYSYYIIDACGCCTVMGPHNHLKSKSSLHGAATIRVTGSRQSGSAGADRARITPGCRSEQELSACNQRAIPSTSRVCARAVARRRAPHV